MRGPEAESVARTPRAEGQGDGVALTLECVRATGCVPLHAGVPVLQAVTVRNDGERPWAGLALQLSVPGFVEAPVRREIGALAPGERHAAFELSPAFDEQRLAGLERARDATLVAEVYAGERLVARRGEPLVLLAATDWDERAGPREALAALCVPERGVARALVDSARARCGPLPAPEADRPRREATRAFAEALYHAVAELGLRAAPPPPGRSLRASATLLDARELSPLDGALLLAATFEAAGWAPVLVWAGADVLVGCWAVADRMPQPVWEDPVRPRKLARVGDLLLFDPAALWSADASLVSFDDACAAARRRLEDPVFERDEQPFALLDVAAARVAGIEPLALERYEPGGVVTLPAVPDGAAPAGTAPVSEPTGREGPDTEPPDGASADAVARRIARWRDRLLDLTLRNRLIAFRPGASGSIPLVVPSPQALFDRLETGGALQLVAAPPKRRRSGARGDDRAALARELAAGRLPVPLAEPELERRLRALGRRARALLREQGASPLYVALGLLRWSEDETGEPQRFAPLVLVPVELERASARERYRLRRGEDEPRLNRTLCEKLRIDFGLDVGPIVALDRDDAPPAFEAVLEAFTRAIARIDRWDVLPACHLALFSFTKFVMWHDLAESADRLLESMLVRGLARGDLSALARASAPLDEARLDALSPPERTYLVADADSSQLAAVLAAADGRSFVLQGPPGTGKSQTITNLIAHAIASGRTVLFVSEKMAALEVVRGRLERVGLGGLCLEVHAHRGGKRRVVEQLARALRAERPDPARTRGQWARLSGKLAEARQVLDASVRRLHERDGWGLSAFEAIDRLTALGDGPAVAPALERARPDPDRLERWREAAAELGELAAPLAPLPEHPFAASALTEWSPALEARLDTELEVLRGAQQRLAQACEALGEALGRRLPDTFAALRAGAQLAQTLLEAPGVPVALWELVSESERAAERVGAWLEIGRRRAALRERLFAKRWRPALLEQDLAALERAVREASGRGWLGRWWARRSLARRLAPVLAEGAELGSLERAAADLARARKLAALEARWREADRFGQRCFGDRWPRADEVEAVLGWAGRLREALAELEAQLPADERGAAWLERLVRLVGFVPERGRRGAEATVLRERLEAFVAAWRRCESALETVNASLRLEPERVWGAPGEPGLLDRVAGGLERLHAALASLRPWAWLRARCEALLREEPALQPLVDALYGGTIEPQAAVAVFERGLLRRWLRERIESEPLLGRFHRAERERWLERFRRLDREHIEAAAEVVRALLGERLPVGAGSERAVAEASEVGLLLREARKKRAHLPLRRLFARMPHLLPRLAPCLLMSPLSVASHLEPGGLRFDLVVFDEASQIPTHEAIGAIARGRQLVVVGDSRQLPPTTFFDRVIGEQEAESEADEDALVELESVLDECCASRMPEMSLRLHYRSRDEALIAFSNRHYYEGRLETFPAPVRVGSPGRGPLGVLWRPVPQGVYDRSGSRTNRAEAEAVVAEVVGALRDPDRRGRSIGVVTFSLAQQQLVEDLLEDARRAHPEIEPWFGDAVPEPVFVKNLENVQGDERDVIVLSVCYGPDASGRVRMHFGPLNREGGERRLNVAITRAREQLVVVSTLTPEQIDLGRTRARGVAHLKRFLAYARDGQRVLESLAAEAARHEPSAIARALGEALRERGWEVAEGVGRSGWRIDLAAGERGASHWRLGVIVDGPAFARAATVRVRERTREAVLASMGWRLHRVYALEWHFDREGVVARVHEAIERACAEAHAQPFEALLRARWRNVPDTSRAAGEPEPESEGDGGGGGETGAGAPLPVEPASPADGEGAPEGADGEVAVVGAAASGGETQQAAGGEAGGDGGAVRLAVWSVFATEAPLAPPERLFAEGEEAAIERRLLAVAEHEAPVHERELLRRVAAGWGHERLTARVRRRLEGLLERVVAGGRLRRDDDGFIWLAGQDPAAWWVVRRAGGDTPVRRPQHVPVEECAAACRAVLERAVGLPEAALVREAAELLGWGRVGRHVRARLERGIERLLERGLCRRDGERIVWR